jgi:uncharacterized protein with PIN domain
MKLSIENSMTIASFRFYAELNDFLRPEVKFTTFEHEVRNRPSVKDKVEALGVPHTEVDLILVNGEPVGFSTILQGGDRVSVYPPFESFDISPVVHLRPTPLDEPCFVLDAHLGKLAAYLRMLGFDALYRNDYQDEELALVSSRERRVLLTRDRGLLKRGIVKQGYCIRHTEPRRQLVEVIERYDLMRSIVPFSRCMNCNGLLEPVSKEAIQDRLLPKTKQYYDQFHICQNCDQLYWRGSHFEKMMAFIQEMVQPLDKMK